MTEKEILSKISEHKREARRLGEQLREFRMARAEKIRKMYFRERMSQVEISRVMGIRQGSVSRIISDQSCARF